MTGNKIIAALAVQALAAALACAPAGAADFAGKNINLIIGFGAGGGYDTNGRLFAR